MTDGVSTQEQLTSAAARMQGPHGGEALTVSQQQRAYRGRTGMKHSRLVNSSAQGPHRTGVKQSRLVNSRCLCHHHPSVVMYRPPPTPRGGAPEPPPPQRGCARAPPPPRGGAPLRQSPTAPPLPPRHISLTAPLEPQAPPSSLLHTIYNYTRVGVEPNPPTPLPPYLVGT